MLAEELLMGREAEGMTLRYVARTQIQAQVGGRQGRTGEMGVE